MTKHLKHRIAQIAQLPLLVSAIVVSLAGLPAHAAQKTSAAKKAAKAKSDSSAAPSTATPPTVRITPRIRYEMLPDSALPAMRSKDIEAFLAEMMVLDEAGLSSAPRIVSSFEGRQMISKGDRVYARGSNEIPLSDDQDRDQVFRVFRNTTPLKDPISGEILGYEAKYIGKAVLVRSEDSNESEVIPATIDILSAKEEIRIGDRLFPEPRGTLQTYTPHPPFDKIEARIVSLYGSTAINASQNQIVAINLGASDGAEAGLILSIQKDGARIPDTTEDRRVDMKLPDERNGLLMVFRVFERVSYGLILNITDRVRIGDKLVNPHQ